MKHLTISLIVACTLVLAGCAASGSESSSASSNVSQSNSSSASSTTNSSSVSNPSSSTATEEDNVINTQDQITSSNGDITLNVNGGTLQATLEDNSSATAFAELIESGPLTIDMHDYGNMEKVGDLGASLPTNDTQITTVPGDIILYQSDKVAVYYAPNSWNFTKLGHINGANAADLKNLLGSGDTQITFSLA